LQQAVEVEDDDTPETLSSRIIKFEHQLYVEAIKKVVEGNYQIVGRSVKFPPKTQITQR
jgi:phosphoribosylglycinamide formyltransferase-1